MVDIGNQLQQAREARGLSLEQVHKATRIKLAYLEAIEAGRFDDLPGTVQARGFVRSYANYLSLDADNLLVQMDGASIGAATPRPAVTPVGPSRPESNRARSPTSSRLRSPSESNGGLPLPLPLLILGAILLFAIGGFLILQALGGEAPAPTPTLPPSVPAAISAAPAATSTLAPSPEVSVTLIASEHVWVRVSSDGFTAFEGILAPGEPQSWQGKQQIIVETGNGAALNVAANGQDIGVLGPRNRVVIRAWGPEGEVTPAPTAVPQTPEATTAP